MAFLTKNDLPVASAADKFSVPPGAAIAAGTGAYGTATAAGASRWVLGSTLKGRKLLVVVNTGAIANAPTAIKVALHGGGTNSSGASGAEIASTVTEWATPAGNSVYTAEIDLAAVTDITKYYSLAVSVNGAGATSTVVAGASGHVLEAPFVS